MHLFHLIGLASWGVGLLRGFTCQIFKIQIGKKLDMFRHWFFMESKKESVWLRMVGVTRMFADGLSEVWRRKRTAVPNSYNDIRGWINELSDQEWSEVIPVGSSLTPQQCRILWQTLRGKKMI